MYHPTAVQSSLSLLVMLPPLQDDCPLVVVVVNSQSLQTDGAFGDQRRMQRVQSRDDLWKKIHTSLFLFYPSFSLSLSLSENISSDLSAVRLQWCRIGDDRKGRGSGREGAAVPGRPGVLGDAHWRGGQRDGSCGRQIKTNGMQRYAETQRSKRVSLRSLILQLQLVSSLVRQVHPWRGGGGKKTL